jgi:hypothetical protein
MKSAEVEAKLEKLAKTVEKLEAEIQLIRDIEAIKKLQRAYGYYLEHWQEEELIGLWSHSPDVACEINDFGLFKGWEGPQGVRSCFSFVDHYPAYGGLTKAPGEYLHILIPLAGIVDVNPDGVNAKGRWYGYFLGAMPREGQTRSLIGCGIWENEYVKEDGIWKFKKLFWSEIISSPLEEGWVKKPSILNPPHRYSPPMGPNTKFAPYPSGYIFPYHYKNPVTGK